MIVLKAQLELIHITHDLGKSFLTVLNLGAEKKRERRIRSRRPVVSGMNAQVGEREKRLQIILWLMVSVVQRRGMRLRGQKVQGWVTALGSLS